LTIFDYDDRFEKMKAANIASTYAPFLRHLHLTSWGHVYRFWQEVIPFIADFKTPRLQSLALSNFAWHSLSPTERSAFLSRFESIISLRLSLYCQTPPIDVATIIYAFPHLQKLFLMPSLHRFALPGPSPLSPRLRLPERLSTLHVLHLDQDCLFVLEWLCSIPEQLSIHTLRIFTNFLCPQELDTVNRFLKTLGPSLEVFRYDSDGMFIPSAPTVELL
jgi:hypothetical protein